MAKRINLREFQERVFARLREVAANPTAPAKLGVQVGDQFFLVDMRDASEVVPVPKLMSVALAKSWFSGVANIRGNLFSVTDLQEYSGHGKTTSLPSNRLLLVHPRWMHNTSVLVTAMLGLRYVEQFQARPLPEGVPPWCIAEYQDKDGRCWREISIGALVQSPDYLKVGVVD